MSQPESTARGLARAGIHVLLGLAGFMATAAFLGRALPEPHVADVTPKLQAIRDADPPYDVILLGNSRVYYQLDPVAFDAAVVEAGGPAIRSYNLGSNAVSVFESHYLLERILEDPRRRPRAVVWDLAIRPCPPRRDLGTSRFAHWHRAEETLRAISWELADDLPLTVRLDRAGRHLAAFVNRTVHRGELATWIGSREPPPAPLFDERGYLAMRDDPDPGARAKREAFLAALARGSWPPPRRGKEPSRREQEVVAWVIELLERHGVEPILMVSPVGDDVSSPLGSSQTRVHGHPIHRFDTSSEHPELHDPGAFYDATHLDREGGRRLVRALARRIVPGQLAP